MKKLYNGKGKRVHPSPPTSPPNDHLSTLPAAILALAAALTAEEQEVLAYLLSGGGGSGWERSREKRKERRQNHPPELGCGCFGCYKSFWARWDASPNRHVIHLIIDAFEETLESKEMMGRAERGRSRRRRSGRKNLAVAEEEKEVEKGLVTLDGHVADEDEDEEGEDVGEGECKSSVRRFVSFIGERFLGVWN